MFQGFKQLRLRNWAPLAVKPAAVSTVVLTHAHIDHSGYVPLLVRDGFAGKIYCTEATYELCRILLPDWGRLQEEEAEYANRRGFSKHKPALPLAGLILELSQSVPRGMGRHQAELLLDDGRAWSKFQAIYEAQGEMRTPTRARHTCPVPAACAGHVASVDNRRLARVAKLAGAPKAPAAGVEFLAPLECAVGKGQPLFVVHAEAPGELEYAMDYVRSQPDIVSIAESEG